MFFDLIVIMIGTEKFKNGFYFKKDTKKSKLKPKYQMTAKRLLFQFKIININFITLDLY